MKECTWTCDACADEEPCSLTVEANVEIFDRPEYCPFDSEEEPNWESPKNQV